MLEQNQSSDENTNDVVGLDRVQLAELVRDRRESLLRIAYRMVGPQVAEDLVHDAIAVAFEQRLRFQNRAAPFSWLCGILMNLCRAELKRRSRRSFFSLSWIIEPAQEVVRSSPLARIELNERQVLLQKALDRLPEKQRAAIVLVNFENLSARDAGAILGMSESALWKNLSRGREQLRSLLNDRV